ncbi:MAG: MFS transporter [Gemmataceae bacterium]|nr:MFS transporter [Gemmataceae bacterium]MDW8265408.1 MFS transporter [Gemmataceae bacterium]
MHLRQFLRAGHWPTLLCAFLYFDVSFMVWVLLGALANSIVPDLGLNDAERGLLVAVPLLGGAVLRPVLGALTDRIGARRTAQLGMGLTLVPLWLGWQWADRFTALLVTGLLLGVAGASFAVALPLASRWYPPRFQGLALGIAGAGNSGTALAVFFAPRLAAALGWRAVFGLALLPLVLTLLVFTLFARESPCQPPPKPWRAYAVVLRQADTWWFCLFYAVTFGGFVGLASFLNSYFRLEHDLDLIAAGTFATICVLAGSFLRPIGGYLADRLGGVRLLVVLYLGLAAVMLGLSGAPPLTSSAGLLLVAMALLGLGNGAVFQLVPQRFPQEIGVVTGIVGAAGGLGGFVLPNLLGGWRYVSGSFAGGFTAVAIVALAAALALRRVSRTWEGVYVGVGGRADDTPICQCHGVGPKQLAAAIAAGKTSLAALGQATGAGTSCGDCQPLLAQILAASGTVRSAAGTQNKIEILKAEKDGLDALPDILRLAPSNNWQQLSEDDKQRAKWHGLFFRKPTPGHFMMRLRLEAGRTNSRQFRLIADLSDEYGKGFCDLTTRQQIQLRWFTLADVPDIWRRLGDVGLGSQQTGMDNVRGVCGCPLAGLTPHELLDATPVVQSFTRRIVGNREFSNLPRKFNVTITGCLENCCPTETQDLALVPAYRELDGRQVNGFNVLVGGKQGSGGYRPAEPLDVFVPPDEATELCLEITRLYRDHGPRASRTRARLAFLLEERGLVWFRDELARRWRRPLLAAGTDWRKPQRSDHLGIRPQKTAPDGGPALYSVGFCVPVGRITTSQMRQVADLAERYGNGELRLTVEQNIIVPNVPEARLGALTEEPICKELPFDPSPILRGLVCCTGIDYCHLALIETKTWAMEVARELERRTAGQKVQPLSIHWSGCSAGCGLHQAAAIGLQGCRTRVNGQIVDAVHVCVRGRTGPQATVATDVLYDVPCSQLADVLEPLVRYLPRSG